MAAADKKAAASAEKLVDLVALQPVKYGGKRVGPGGDLLGVPQGVAVAMLTKGLAAVGAEAQAKAEAEAQAKAEAEAKAKAEAEAKAKAEAEAQAGGQAALLPEGDKQ